MEATQKNQIVQRLLKICPDQKKVLEVLFFANGQENVAFKWLQHLDEVGDEAEPEDVEGLWSLEFDDKLRKGRSVAPRSREEGEMRKKFLIQAKKW